MKTWKDLTQKERDNFADDFYSLWEQEGFGEPDTESSSPWGCPWDWDENGEYETPECFFNANKCEFREFF
jgi:hypothetical protein